MANSKADSHFEHDYQEDFSERVQLNQQKLTAELDFLGCGFSGSDSREALARHRKPESLVEVPGILSLDLVIQTLRV
jgi:hypothetical protein